MTQTTPRILTDRDPFPLPEAHISGEGYLTLSARIARTGLQAYYGHELVGAIGEIEPDRLYQVYRAPDEVFADAAIESFRDLPITLGHPPEEVSAENYKQYAIGHVIGLPVRSGDFLRAELSLRDKTAIEHLRAGEARELSVGYHAEVALISGVTPGGQTYDAVQTQIQANHIALVTAARCGPQCRIGDELRRDCTCPNCQSSKEYKMSELVTLDGEKLPLAEAVDKLKAANGRMAEALKDAEATIASLEADLETKTGEVEAMTAKETAGTTEDGAFTAKVQARAQIIADARQILGDGASLSQLADADIQRRVIDSIYGAEFATGASENALSGMYRVAVRDALKSSDSLNGRIAPYSSNTERQLAEVRRNQRLASAWQKGV